MGSIKDLELTPSHKIGPLSFNAKQLRDSEFKKKRARSEEILLMINSLIEVALKENKQLIQFKQTEEPDQVWDLVLDELKAKEFGVCRRLVKEAGSEFYQFGVLYFQVSW